jgi:hypothetical protein
MIKWVLIGLGAVVLIQVLRQNSSSPGFLGSGLNTNSGSGATGFVNSLTGLTSAIGRLIGSSGSTSKSDSDSLIKPSF